MFRIYWDREKDFPTTNVRPMQLRRFYFRSEPPCGVERKKISYKEFISK